jgi:hypothetical protein
MAPSLMGDEKADPWRTPVDIWPVGIVSKVVATKSRTTDPTLTPQLGGQWTQSWEGQGSGRATTTKNERRRLAQPDPSTKGYVNPGMGGPGVD